MFKTFAVPQKTINYTKRTLLPLPLLKIKEGYSNFDDTTPQKYLENKPDDYFTGEEGVSSDSGIASSDFDLQGTPNVIVPKQSAQYNCYAEQAFKNSNSLCYDERLNLCELSGNDSVCYSCTQNNCLDTDDLEFLNQAYKFYVNDIPFFNSNNCSFSVNF